MTVTREQVTEANRALYDAVAEDYEEIDGRRSPELAAWLRGRLRSLRDSAPGGRLLDVGAGAGFLSRCAEGTFAYRLGTDVSLGILEQHRDAFDEVAVSDGDTFPVDDSSFDAVCAFAVLHHLYDFEWFVEEVARVLVPGGVFYSDHDMDAEFFRRFRWPLRVYRALRGAGERYAGATTGVSRDVFELSECHADGIPADTIADMFRRHGFEVELGFHWYGLTPLTDRCFGTRLRSRGRAPLVSLVCRKPQSAKGPCP